MPFFGGGTVSFLVQSATLTDIEIKALPTTAVTILPAETGTILYPLFAHIRMQWVADYGNIDASAQLQIFIGSNSSTLWTLKQALASGVSALLAGGGPDGTHAFFSPRFVNGAAISDSFSSLANFYDSDVVNLPIKLSMNNGGAGDLDGGDAGNSLTVEVYYVRIAVT